MFVYCQKPIRITVTDPIQHINNPYILVPCGQCIFCRFKARKEWTLRLRLEASLYEESSFATLTYDPKNVPPEVQVRDVQLFIKRLRKNSKLKFRFYSVAEYGSKTERPHFHVILFGLKLNVAVKYVDSCWGLGFTIVSPLINERCNYACGYTQKKYDKRMDKSLFQLFPELSYNERLALYVNCGDILEKEFHKKIDPRRAEFATCSLGIGLGYLDKNYKDITEKFFINFGGKNYSIPRYFRKKIEERDLDWSERWKDYMTNYAEQRLVKFFDKSSVEFLNQDIGSVEVSEGVYVEPDYDMWIEDRWKDYVDYKAKTIEAKRSLFKDKKKSYKEC